MQWLSFCRWPGVLEHRLATLADLRFLAAVAATGPQALFFAGDLGQRIFQQPFSWKGLGVDVRGRSTVLKVNYRTSHQIRASADRLMPKLDTPKNLAFPSPI